jgi:hypothetical protein
MNKLILVCLLAVIVLAGARTAPRTHSDFFTAPNDQFILGYFLDWVSKIFIFFVHFVKKKKKLNVDKKYFFRAMDHLTQLYQPPDYQESTIWI